MDTNKVSKIADTFKFISFPKPVKEKKATGWKTIQAKSKKSRKKRTVRLNLPNSKTFPQLVKELDTMVSAFILKKGKYTCVRCHKQYLPKQRGLTCSHYWDRQYKSVRWDKDNLDPLCWRPCHSQKWEHDKQGEYKDYMLRKLGVKGYNKLEIKARSITKFSRVDLRLIIDNFNHLYVC